MTTIAPLPIAPEATVQIEKLPASPWRLAFFLAFLALFCGVLLTGVSMWFLGAVALAGLGPAALTFNFHFPAAFVRLFALGRTAAKYGERVVGHRAALLDQVARRSRLFRTMAAAPAIRAAGWQLGNEDRLSDYLDDVEDVDYARLRATMPFATLMVGLAVLVTATAVLTPTALLFLGPLMLAAALFTQRFLPRARRDWFAIRTGHRFASRSFGTALGALIPLRAERAWAGRLDAVAQAYAGSEATRLDERRRLASLDALLSVAGPLSAFVILGAAWHAGMRGTALLPTAFLAFSWLALGEAMQGVSRIATGKLRQKAAAVGLAEWSSAESGTETAAPRQGTLPPPLKELVLKAVKRVAPDGRPLGGTVDLVLRAGHPTALAGPSGCGKTSLLKQIAGWIDAPGDFRTASASLDPASRRTLVHLGLHDAAILSDTVRENLFAPGRGDAELWQALDAVELGPRIREGGGLDTWMTQDSFSLGEAQRLNLARAWLSGMPIVLLDEPTEHLDREQAERILDRLLTRLSDRIVVYATHNVGHATPVFIG
ncbi:MAG: ATP-binding cassette domain-containing protein [Rhizobiaceae bacterium]|nr:MAG: ATP-binding cassette domain-containing protein [Rhizobiaceae bacterium]